MTEATSNIFGKKYEILSKLGQGGFATVYLAKDITLGRKVALKVLDAQLSQNDPSFLKRFEREAQTVAQLNHSHIVDVYEFGQESGRYFSVGEKLTYTAFHNVHRSWPARPRCDTIGEITD